jgi:hypothetical protein
MKYLSAEAQAKALTRSSIPFFIIGLSLILLSFNIVGVEGVNALKWIVLAMAMIILIISVWDQFPSALNPSKFEDDFLVMTRQLSDARAWQSVGLLLIIGGLNPEVFDGLGINNVPAFAAGLGVMVSSVSMYLNMRDDDCEQDND